MGVPVAVRHVMRRRRRPRGGQPFDPLTAFDWKAAFYAGDPLWTPPADGDPVSSWRDGGSEGKNAVQATGTKQPAYRASVAALNDKPAVQGDGVDDFLQTANWTSALSQPNSIVIVGTFAATGTNAYVGGNDATNRQSVLTDSGVWRLFAGTGINGSAASAGAHLAVAVFDATDVLEVDGASVVSGNAGANAIDGMTLFANYLGLGIVGDYIAFAAAIAGDVTADDNWPSFVAWVESHYGLVIA